MGKFNLSQTFGTDIATTFRYMIEIDTNKDSAASQAGLNKIQKYSIYFPFVKSSAY